MDLKYVAHPCYNKSSRSGSNGSDHHTEPERSCKKETTVRARIDPALKAKAENLAEGRSLPSEAVRLFQQVTFHKGLPFEVRIPNAETKGLESAKSGREPLEMKRDHGENRRRG
jgi:antitoxin component of RelBE/YafQ-DinJ toxin-antitoxin module